MRGREGSLVSGKEGRTVPTQITDASRVLLATVLIIAPCYNDLIAQQLTQQLKPVFVQFSFNELYSLIRSFNLLIWPEFPSLIRRTKVTGRRRGVILGY